MNCQRILMLVLFLFWLPVNFAGAQDHEAGRSSYKMDEIVVTSAKIEEYAKNYPQDVKMVKRSEIVQRNLPNVEEVLKTISGVEVYSTSGIGSRIAIRGSGKSGTLAVSAGISGVYRINRPWIPEKINFLHKRNGYL